MHKLDEDILNAAVETYNLEKSLDPDVNALAAALEAGFALHEQRVTERIILGLEELATHIEEVEEFPSFEGIAALKLFAHDLRSQIPKMGEPYSPEDDDIVQVILSGEVKVYRGECSHCGSDTETSTWSVNDRASGMEYFFDPQETKNLRVRIISPDVTDFLES